jgi:hypothetical protein
VRTTFNFALVDGENFTDCNMSVHLFHFHPADMLQWTRRMGLLSQYRDYAMRWDSRESRFDYLLEQRFVSTPLPSGVPCSITYWSTDLSLRLFCLEYPVQLSTGAKIYLYISSAWSTLLDYLLEQRFISTPLPSGAYLASSLIEAN